jgi:hypothetical protein
MEEIEMLEKEPLIGDGLPGGGYMDCAIPAELWHKLLACARREVERQDG